MASPRVSVLMSVYNGEKHLGEAIQSILNQTYTDFEFIIVDDGSTDSTRNIINSFDDKRIKLIINEKNIGWAKSLIKGIEYCQCEFIARMDADDISLPQRFEKQIEYMDSNPEIGVIGTNVYAIGENSKPKYKIEYPQYHSFIKWSLIFSNPICHPSVMIRKSIVKNYGYFDDNIIRSEEYDYWSRIVNNVKFHNIQDFLLLLRISGNKVSISLYSEQLQSAINICRRNLSYYIDSDIDEVIIKGFWTWKFATIANAKKMIGAIIKANEKFLDENKLSEKEITMIHHDTARRILLIAVTKLYSPTMIINILKTIKYDIFGIFRTLFWGIIAIINKYLK